MTNSTPARESTRISPSKSVSTLTGLSYGASHFCGELLQAHQVLETLLHGQTQVLANQRSIDVFLVELDHGIRLKFCAALDHVALIICPPFGNTSLEDSGLKEFPRASINGAVIVVDGGHFILKLIRTTSPVCVPRESASCLPSREKSNPKMRSEVKSVNCFRGAPLTGCAQRFETPPLVRM